MPGRLRSPRTVPIALLALLGAGLCLLTTSAAFATIVVPVNDRDLATQAVAVVVGRVGDIESHWESTRRHIFTDIRIALEEVLKGTLAVSEITIRQPGGRVRGVTAWLDGAPEFHRGERVLLFLTTNRDGTLRVAHLYQGKFALRFDGARGEEMAHPESAALRVRVLPGRGARTRLPERAAAFRQRIRALAAAGRGAVPAPVTAPSVSGAAISESHESFTFLGPAPARWLEPDAGQPVRMLIQAGGQPGAPGGGFEQVRAAYRAWNEAGSGFRWEDAGVGGATGFSFDGVNAISFGDPAGQLDPPSGCRGTLALGGFFRSDAETSTVNGQTFERIVEGDVVIADGWGGCGFYESFDSFAEVVTHELGHVLGLGHSGDGDATMHAVAHFDGRGAALRADDVAGVRFMYPLPSPKLSVTITGAGTVTSAPGGIACGADCEETYPMNTAVTLTAAASAGSSFAGWSGGGCSGLGTCRVVLAGPVAVRATFQQVGTGITVTFPNLTPGQTVSGTPRVQITASGTSGSSNRFYIHVDGVQKDFWIVSGTTIHWFWKTGPLANGEHVLSVRVVDATGKSGIGSITVRKGTSTPPPPPPELVASFTSPGAGTTVAGTVNVGMSATGVSGSPTVFRLAVDGTVVSTQSVTGTGASYAWETTAVADGPHTLTLTVTDGAGRTATATRSVTVTNAPPPPPDLVASFTTPAAGASVSGTVNVGMSASGVSGSPTTFQLAIDDAVVSTENVSGTTASYEWVTTAVSDGPHTLTLTVTDGAGRTATATRSVTVANTPPPPPPPPPPGVTVSFPTLTAGQTITGGSIRVTISAAGTAAGSLRYHILVDGVQKDFWIINATTIHWWWSLGSLTPGEHTLSVTVVDGTGQTGTGSVTVVRP